MPGIIWNTIIKPEPAKFLRKIYFSMAGFYAIFIFMGLLVFFYLFFPEDLVGLGNPNFILYLGIFFVLWQLIFKKI